MWDFQTGERAAISSRKGNLLWHHRDPSHRPMSRIITCSGSNAASDSRLDIRPNLASLSCRDICTCKISHHDGIGEPGAAGPRFIVARRAMCRSPLAIRSLLRVGITLVGATGYMGVEVDDVKNKLSVRRRHGGFAELSTCRSVSAVL